MVKRAIAVLLLTIGLGVSAGCTYVTVDDANKMIAAAKAEYTQRHAALDARITPLNDIDGRVGRLLDKVVKLHDDLAALKKDVGDVRETMDKVITAQAGRVRKVTDDVATCRQEVKALEVKVADNARRLDTCQAEVAALEKRVAVSEKAAATSYDLTRDLLTYERNLFDKVRTEVEDLKSRLDATERPTASRPAVLTPP